MKRKAFLLGVSCLFALSAYSLFSGQERPHSHEWGPRDVANGQALTRPLLSDRSSVPANASHGQLFPAGEETALGPIIPDFKVSDDTTGEDQGWPSIATDSSGNFVITWHDLRNGDYDIYAQRYATDGTALAANFKVNDDVSSEWQVRASIGTDGNGNFVITWTDMRDGNLDIYAQRYVSDGTPVDSNFKVNDDTLTAMQDLPSIAADGSGDFLISWRDCRDDTIGDIYAQRYASDGTPLDTNLKVNDDTSGAHQTGPAAVAYGNGDFVITWVDYRSGDADIYVQRYTSDGTPIGGNFRVDNDTTDAGVYSTSIATHGGGGFVIAWSDLRNGWPDIYAQRYAGDGTPIGGNFRVNDDLVGWGSQASPSIAADGSGNFVITWQDPRNGWDDVYAQRYDSDGAPLDSNFRVTDTGYLMQWSPDVKLWNDRIYSTWTDHRAGGTEFDIWANVLDWHDPVGTEEGRSHREPSAVALSQNHPNPFDPTTTIVYSIPEAELIQLTVYDASGRVVRKLVDERRSAGEHRVLWDGRDERGGSVGSGVYFYTLVAGADELISKKMLLLR